MSSTKISIIMPVYGVEKYLENAINSVINQTISCWELILVDDKSPDSCPEICDSFVQKDKRIRVIHKAENEGLGFARNTGLDAAKGEFIYFFDSDDYLEADLLKKALSAMTDETQLVVFGFNRAHEDADGNIIKTERFTPEEMCCTSSDDTARIFTMLNKNRVFPFVWNKLYRKSFLDSCKTRFEKTKLIEDFLFNIDIFSKASHITVISDNLYNYRKPAHETLASAYSPDFFKLCKRKYNLEKDYLDSNDNTSEEDYQTIYLFYVKHLFSVFIKNRSPKAGLSFSQQKKQITEALNDITTEEVFESYRPKELPMKVITGLLKTKNPYICLLLSSLVKQILT